MPVPSESSQVAMTLALLIKGFTRPTLEFSFPVKEWNDETILSANAMYIKGPSIRGVGRFLQLFISKSWPNFDPFPPLHCWHLLWILELSSRIGITYVKILIEFCCCLQINFWSGKLKNTIWCLVFFNFSNKNFAVDSGILTGICICLHGGPGGVRGSENTLT